MTESTLARAEAVDTLEAYDIVFTPSSFCQKSLVDAGLSTPAVVWGHGFDPEYFSYVEPKPNRPFTFLWFGDENRRKGYDVFLEAFKKLDIPNVRAWVRGPGTGIINSISAKYKGDPRIVWDTGVTPPAKIKDMVAEVDVLVSPLRGEGFLLPALEMMASGRPVIMTRFSGPMDFGGGDDLTYWIDTCGSEPGQNDWGVQKIPSMEHLLTLMRHCATHPEEVRQRGREACRVAHLSWRWDQKVLEFLPAIRKMIPDCRI
jgi:glycosyltransferase involved in cell wall biosynthesis